MRALSSTRGGTPSRIGSMVSGWTKWSSCLTISTASSHLASILRCSLAGRGYRHGGLTPNTVTTGSIVAGTASYRFRMIHRRSRADYPDFVSAAQHREPRPRPVVVERAQQPGEVEPPGVH